MRDLHWRINASEASLVAVATGRTSSITLELSSATKLAGHRGAARGARNLLAVAVNGGSLRHKINSWATIYLDIGTAYLGLGRAHISY